MCTIFSEVNGTQFVVDLDKDSITNYQTDVVIGFLEFILNDFMRTKAIERAMKLSSVQSSWWGKLRDIQWLYMHGFNYKSAIIVIFNYWFLFGYSAIRLIFSRFQSFIFGTIPVVYKTIEKLFLTVINFGWITWNEQLKPMNENVAFTVLAKTLVSWRQRLKARQQEK